MAWVILFELIISCRASIAVEGGVLFVERFDEALERCFVFCIALRLVHTGKFLIWFDAPSSISSARPVAET